VNATATSTPTGPGLPAPGARRHRRLLWLMVALGLPLLGFFALRWALQPERLGALLLDRAAAATGLVLDVAEPARLGIWPRLQLELIGLTARSAPSASPLLQAERVDVALPLSMLWRQDELQLGELRLLGPVLDLAALQDWRAQRAGPEQPLQLPEIALALQLQRGSLLGDGWSVVDLDLQASPLRDGQLARIDANGSFLEAERRLPLALRLQAQITQNVDGVRLREASLQLGDRPGGDTLRFSGEVDLLLPTALRIALEGEIDPRWPAGWPALPDPLAAQLLGQPLTLGFLGRADLDGELSLASRGEERELVLQARPQQLIDWFDSSPRPPLPPLAGSFRSAELQFEQVRLEGVSIRLEPAQATPADD
jgi:hypothetical protein